MKRIKLFEAFTNVDKIEVVNVAFFKWIILVYISDTNFKIGKDKNSFNIEKDDDIVFSYYPNSNFISHINIERFYPLLRKYIAKSAFNLVNMPNPGLRTIFRKSAHSVIKKLYQDEKNKTI